jgi:hypothetical protein
LTCIEVLQPGFDDQCIAVSRLKAAEKKTAPERTKDDLGAVFGWNEMCSAHQINSPALLPV